MNLSVLILFVTSLASGVYGQVGSSVIVFRNANVIDGIANKPLRNVTVTLKNGRIDSISKLPVRPSASTEVIDLKGQWIMPGYIDAHVHFGSVDDARKALFLGSTTVRTMHSEHFLDIQIREAHKRGRSDLPDVFAAGYQIRPDMSATFFDEFTGLSDMSGRVAGRADVRRALGAMLSKGVDHIKFLATERSGTPGTDPKRRTFDDDEIEALVDEARRAGLFVAAHAHGDEGAYAAVKAGVRSIEHGTFMTERTLKLMQKNSTYLVVTFTGGSQPPVRPEYKDDPILRERRRINLANKDRLIRRAVELGIPLAAGTDLRYTTLDLSIADEALFMQAAGLKSMAILKIITMGSATCLGIQNRTGALRKGLEADMVILGTNPLLSLKALKDIKMVVNDGTLVVVPAKKADLTKLEKRIDTSDNIAPPILDRHW